MNPPYQTFASWRQVQRWGPRSQRAPKGKRKACTKERSQEPAAPRFARLEIDASASASAPRTPSAPLRIELPGGARLQVADAAGATLAAALLRELAKPQPAPPC